MGNSHEPLFKIYEIGDRRVMESTATLRDLFAAFAMAGALASSEDGCASFPFLADEADHGEPSRIVAGCCYALADAMIEEREASGA